MSPTQRPYGVSRSQNEPVNSSSASMGSPASRSPRATPSSRGTNTEPMVSVQLQVPRQRSAVDLAAPLEGHPADDQRDQDKQQRQVAGREPGGVPAREGGEDRGAADDQPDLVAVPDRARPR